jgi:hypothetical protein
MHESVLLLLPRHCRGLLLTFSGAVFAYTTRVLALGPLVIHILLPVQCTSKPQQADIALHSIYLL